MPYTSSQLCPVYSNNANFLANKRYCSFTCYIFNSRCAVYKNKEEMTIVCKAQTLNILLAIMLVKMFFIMGLTIKERQITSALNQSP